jgi:hypothetical protein
LLKTPIIGCTVASVASSRSQHLALAANPDFMQRKPGKVEPGPDTVSSKTTSLQPKFLVRLSRAFPKPPQSTLLGY